MPDNAEIRWITASRALKHPDEDFINGCRLLRERVVTIPEDTVAISVSAIKIYDRNYVSGMRFGTRSGDSISLGYRHYINEHLVVCLRRGDDKTIHFLGFHLAQDQRGVRGLAFLIQRPDERLTDWVGDHRDIPKSRLVPSSRGQDAVIIVKGAFDVGTHSVHTHFRSFRLAADPNPRLLNFTTLSDPQGSGALALRDTLCWFSTVLEAPYDNLGAPSIIPEPGRGKDLPAVATTFGGEYGEDLPHVIAITALLEHFNVIEAIQIDFDDGRTSLYLGLPQLPAIRMWACSTLYCWLRLRLR